jgi:hypothetical protein
MKKLLVVLLVVISFVIGHFSAPLPVQASWIPELWTDGIETSSGQTALRPAVLLRASVFTCWFVTG